MAFANAGGVQGNTYVQSFALALAVYTTTYSLGSLDGGEPGHHQVRVPDHGSRGGQPRDTNVASSGTALGVPDGTALTVLQILQIAKPQLASPRVSSTRGDRTMTSALDNLLNAINQAGDIASHVTRGTARGDDVGESPGRLT